MHALVVGNGESRSSIQIGNLTYMKYGCNAVHRDYHMDHLVCVDSRMVIEALKNPKIKNTTVYTRTNWINEFVQYLQVKTVPNLPYRDTKRADDPWHWGSGPYAVLLAANHHSDVHMIGFDLHGKDNLVNNVYKGTDNYLQADKPKVDPSYWIYQIAKVFECFPNTTFTIYNNNNWVLPREWSLPNVRQTDLTCFTTCEIDLLNQ